MLHGAKHATFAVRVKELPGSMSLIHSRLLPHTKDATASRCQ